MQSVACSDSSQFIHTILASAANVADKDALPHLLHGEETTVWGDQGYNGQGKAIRKAAPKTQSLTNKGYRRNGKVDEVKKARNRSKSRIRAWVEHVSVDRLVRRAHRMRW